GMRRRARYQPELRVRRDRSRDDPVTLAGSPACRPDRRARSPASRNESLTNDAGPASPASSPTTTGRLVEREEPTTRRQSRRWRRRRAPLPRRCRRHPARYVPRFDRHRRRRLLRTCPGVPIRREPEEEQRFTARRDAGDFAVISPLEVVVQRLAERGYKP